LTTAGYEFEYQVTIWDKDAKANVTVPNLGPLTLGPTTSTNPAAAAQELADDINANAELDDYIVAKVVNGALVIETLNSNYDVEYSGIMNRTVNPDTALDVGVIEKMLLTVDEKGQMLSLLNWLQKLTKRLQETLYNCVLIP